ncbi:hypothetical protein [uncultured Tissierella sp.]|uniref:phage baseplate plug family protein n=1 Tax=uncultured Tissierella sp. TaxID=448160 RepID=UPI002804D708|nr:hypothetical protein [uncultured Tissierella sp.]MDU5080226.1 hypothetical protein [Bacillota bacterium]
MYEIPLTTEPNQSFKATIPVDGKNIELKFNIRYNTIAEYWVMTVADALTDEILIDSVPLLTGQYPAANLLEQYSYLRIGSAVMVNTSTIDLSDEPNDKNLGTDYILVWGDTIG